MKKVQKPTYNIRFMIFLTLLFLFTATWIGIKITENGTFTVVSNHRVVGTYHHFWLAQRKLKTQNETAYVQNEDDVVVAMNMGIANLNTKDITQNTTYTLDQSEESGYINGHYGADALYLSTNSDATKVKLEISGVQAWFNIDDIELNVWNDSLFVSNYSVKNGNLYHSISTNIQGTASGSYRIGKAPKGLKTNQPYYSYDGHYFYSNFKKMTEDSIKSSHTQAVNQTAYYNYYQYVPHRSASALTQKDFDAYLYSVKGIDEYAKNYPCEDNQSVLFHLGNTFLNAQKKYNINATMMFSLAINESAYGQSEYAIKNNNLFGHSVYDSSPDSADRYTSLKVCIYQHAYHFLQLEYANPNNEKYNGSWFGDKASGINVNYASDPYWGEKAASLYYQLDTDAYKNQNVITVKAENDMNVYDSKNGNILYSYEKDTIASFILIKKENGWYKVKSEAPVKNGKIDPNGNYDSSYAYVKAEDLK